MSYYHDQAIEDQTYQHRLNFWQRITKERVKRLDRILAMHGIPPGFRACWYRWAKNYQSVETQQLVARCLLDSINNQLQSAITEES